MNQEKKYTLLYADDEQAVRENYLLILNNYFKEVHVAKDGKEALDIYYENKPDVVILDIEMPQINGLEVAKKIREDDLDTKIIILTAYSDKHRLFEAIKLNLIDYLVKPIDRVSLKKVINDSFESLAKGEGQSFVDLSPSIKLEINSMLLYQDQELIDLTSYEQSLLKFFYENKNTVVSKIDIYNSVWDSFDKEFNDSSVRNLVKNLRKKLPDGYIENQYGNGYIFKM